MCSGSPSAVAMRSGMLRSVAYEAKPSSSETSMPASAAAAMIASRHILNSESSAWLCL